MGLRRDLVLVLLAALACGANVVRAQMPTQQEMDDAMREMREQMEKLTPEQRAMVEQAYQQFTTEAAPGADDEIVIPGRDAARIAAVPKSALGGAQLKAHVEALQPIIADALTPVARGRAQAIESALRRDGGDTAAKLSAAANGLAAWGAWPEATYLMGKAALASGNAQDLNNLAAFLTMQGAGHAAAPILITLDARYPDNSTLLNNLGQAWFELGDIKEAERVLTLAVRRAPKHPQANVTKSRIEEARGDRAAAIESMRMAIQGGFSEEKAQRLARLGGNLMPGDVRWTMKLPADTLGLSRFVPPPYAMKLSDLWVLPPAWQSFRDNVVAARDKHNAQLATLARQTPWIADAALRGPLTAKAVRMSRQNGDDWERRREQAYAAYTEAIRFEQGERKALETHLAGIHADGEKKYRNVAGGYQYDYACPQIRAAITQYLETSGKRLDEARRGLLDYERQATNERLYYAQFMQTEHSFEYTVMQAKVEFLNVLQGQTLNSGPGLMHQFGNSCLKPDARARSGGKLADFDEIHCERLVEFEVPGIGRWEVRCNRAEIAFGVKVPLEALTVDMKGGWTEDLVKDRVLTASAEVGVADPKGTVRVSQGGHLEFDDDGVRSGGIRGGVEVRVGDKSTAGPLEIGMKSGGSVGIEFDRTGVTDLRIEAGVKSQASSTVKGLDSPEGTAARSTGTGQQGSAVGIGDGTKAGAQASAEVKGSWSWNAGVSAKTSANVRSTFVK
jgi:tetratricopeptide (TPR) repeat protein